VKWQVLVKEGIGSAVYKSHNPRAITLDESSLVSKYWSLDEKTDHIPGVSVLKIVLITHAVPKIV
jgi:hypothetical protein